MTGLQTAPLDSLRDVGSWRGLAEPDRMFCLEVIAASSRRALRAVMTGPEPQSFRSGGPRLVQRTTGLRFCLIPGGRHVIGRRSERRVVHLQPFLLAESPLGAEDAARLFGLSHAPERSLPPGEAPPFYFLPAELEASLPHGLRLPSDVEWEAALRAGTTSTFYWGELQPLAPPALPHPLGLAVPGFYDEVTADHTIRGGAARLWPWQADGAGHEWIWLMSAASRLWRDDEAPRDVAVRPALDLPSSYHIDPPVPVGGRP
jgi:hypothetical protein